MRWAFRGQAAAATQQGEDEHGVNGQTAQLLRPPASPSCVSRTHAGFELQHQDGERAEMVQELGSYEKEQTQPALKTSGWGTRGQTPKSMRLVCGGSRSEFRDKGLSAGSNSGRSPAAAVGL